MKLTTIILLICILQGFVMGKSIIKRTKRNCNSNCNSACNNACSGNSACNNACSNYNCNSCKEGEVDQVPVLIPFPPAQTQTLQPSGSVTNNTNINSYNFTADISLNNVINNINNISVPISVNFTNENRITIEPSIVPIPHETKVVETENRNCCIVVQPNVCDQSGCYVRNRRECGPICTADVITEITTPPPPPVCPYSPLPPGYCLINGQVVLCPTPPPPQPCPVIPPRPIPIITTTTTTTTTARPIIPRCPYVDPQPQPVWCIVNGQLTTNCQQPPSPCDLARIIQPQPIYQPQPIIQPQPIQPQPIQPQPIQPPPGWCFNNNQLAPCPQPQQPCGDTQQGCSGNQIAASYNTYNPYNSYNAYVPYYQGQWFGGSQAQVNPSTISCAGCTVCNGRYNPQECMYSPTCPSPCRRPPVAAYK